MNTQIYQHDRSLSFAYPCQFAMEYNYLVNNCISMSPKTFDATLKDDGIFCYSSSESSKTVS